jgi:hypothetical protein
MVLECWVNDGDGWTKIKNEDPNWLLKGNVAWYPFRMVVSCSRAPHMTFVGSSAVEGALRSPDSPQLHTSDVWSDFVALAAWISAWVRSGLGLWGSQLPVPSDPGERDASGVPDYTAVVEVLPGP